MGELGGVGAAVAAVACLLARSRRAPLLPQRLASNAGVRRLALVAAGAFTALAIALYRAGHGGPQSGPLALTALIVAASALVPVRAVAPGAARALSLLAVGAAAAAVLAGGLR